MEERSTAVKEEGGDGFSAVLNGILSNPDMMAMISSMAGKLKESGSSADSADTVNAAAESTTPAAEPSSSRLPDVVSTLAPLLSGDKIKPSKHDSDRACLLRALKPYLSPGRSEAIDYIIKFSSIADLLKNLS